jgi:integrase
MKVSQKSFVMESGERYVLLVDGQGMPLYWPNLYVTTQVRNRSLSEAAMASALGGISILLRYFNERKVDMVRRFEEAKFFEGFEIDAIRDHCQIKYKKAEADPQGIFSLYDMCVLDEKVTAATEYTRLTEIARYSAWLAYQVNSHADSLLSKQVERMKTEIKARRPVRRGLNVDAELKSVGDAEVELLFEVLRPESELNPFVGEEVKVRNRLMFLLLNHLGVRRGELLSLRVRDFDFGSNQVVIHRLQDEKKDPRVNQPKTKTNGRVLPLRDTLMQEVHRYILSERKSIPGALRNEYLFVVHKSGPTQGQPLSIAAYMKMINVIRSMHPELSKLTGHQLRHHWNNKFSEMMDAMNDPPSTEKQEQMRSVLMGWKQGSGTAAIYNRRFIEGKAHEAAQTLQEGMVRVPKEIVGG